MSKDSTENLCLRNVTENSCQTNLVWHTKKQWGKGKHFIFGQYPVTKVFYVIENAFSGMKSVRCGYWPNMRMMY